MYVFPGLFLQFYGYRDFELRRLRGRVLALLVLAFCLCDLFFRLFPIFERVGRADVIQLLRVMLRVILRLMDMWVALKRRSVLVRLCTIRCLSIYVVCSKIVREDHRAGDVCDLFLVFRYGDQTRYGGRDCNAGCAGMFR